jgi:NAD(P)-dependent dehydrogenase (short-subunit alcohol dehydrogenase family)
MNRLDDKVAIITGAAGGIGVAAAQVFTAAGAKVLMVDRDAGALEAAAATVVGEVSHFAADVTEPAQAEAYVAAALERYGAVDALLANAGIEGGTDAIVDCDVEDFDRVMAVNVRGVWLGLKYVMAAMQDRGKGGSIVITSSTAGVMGLAGMAPYHTSKHAVIGLMRCAALEGGKHGIRVNTVNPGPIETRMMRSIEDMRIPGRGEEIKHQLERRSLDGRYGEPEEVARMMLFLCSDEAAPT